jgi:hypothetical protein
MKPFFTLLFTCFLFNISFAQQFFDPATDTIAHTDARGVWKVLVPEKSLIESAQKITPQLESVQDVRIQDIHGKPYLFFRGKHAEQPNMGFTVMVMLDEISAGIWKTGNIFQACWGNVCSECGFDEYWGCACERYHGDLDETVETYCEHKVSIGMGLAKVEIANPFR